MTTQAEWQKLLEESIAHNRANGYVYNGDQFTHGNDIYEVVSGGLDPKNVQSPSGTSQQTLEVRKK